MGVRLRSLKENDIKSRNHANAHHHGSSGSLNPRFQNTNDKQIKHLRNNDLKATKRNDKWKTD